MKYLYLILSILLLLCLLPMPYSYYMLVRCVAMVAFGVMAYQYFQPNKKGWAITFGALTLLFQPFIKIALGRTMCIVIRLQEIFFVGEKKGGGGKNVEKIFCRMGKKLYLCSRFMSERLEQVSTERTLDDHSAVFS